MKKSSLAFGASLVLGLTLLTGGGLRAQQPTTAGSTKPGLGHGPAVEKSVPSSAPAATTTQTTGATDQGKAVKAMNKKEKTKVEKTGK